MNSDNKENHSYILRIFITKKDSRSNRLIVVTQEFRFVFVI